MLRGRIGRPSPALVVACVALFVALSGTGYAVIVVPRANHANFAKSAKNAQTVDQLHARSYPEPNTLLALDGEGKFPASVFPPLPPGPKGDKGDPGAKGEPGERGPPGLRGQEGPAGTDAATMLTARIRAPACPASSRCESFAPITGLSTASTDATTVEMLSPPVELRPRDITARWSGTAGSGTIRFVTLTDSTNSGYIVCVVSFSQTSCSGPAAGTPVIPPNTLLRFQIVAETLGSSLAAYDVIVTVRVGES